MSDPQKAVLGAQASEQVQETSLLDQIVTEGRLARGAETTEKGKNLVRDFVDQVLKGAMTVSKDAEAMITARIAEIDRLVSVQLNEVLHHASFQKLEGTWRGLKYLLDQSETSDKLKIRVLNATKTELLRDLQRAPEFDQSALFKKVYEEEFGVFGGAPFAALVGDYEFGRGPEDIDLLERISQGSGLGACSLPDRGESGDVESGQLHVDRRTARHGEDLRQHGICQVEEFPCKRRLAVRGTCPAAHSDAPALRQERRDGGYVQLSGRRGRVGPFEVPVGQCGVRPGGAVDQRVRPLWMVRGDSRRGRRRVGRRAADAQFHHGFGGHRIEVSHGSADYGPAREGVGGPGIRSAGAL